MKTTETHVIDCDAAPFCPKGWTVEEHRKGGQFEWNPNKVSLYLDESQQNGKVTVGNKLRKKLVNLEVANANMLDYLLAHPDLIPEEWKGEMVFFWGTIYYYSPDGTFFVRYLCRDEDCWYHDYEQLDNGWDSDRSAAISQV